MEELIELSNDINVITAEINSYKQVAGQAIFEIGKRLKHVKEKDLVHGEFGEWCQNELNFSHRQANRYMKVYSKFGNSTLGANLSFKKLDMLSSLDDEQLETQVETSSGELKKPTEMTQKEIEEFKKALKEKEEKLKHLEQENSKLNDLYIKEKNKPPLENTIEIDKTDYESINKLNNQIQQKQKSYELLMNEKQALENKMKLIEKENDEFQNLKKQIEHLTREKEDISRQIDAATSISGLVIEIDHLIKEKLAPVKYSKAIQEMQYDEIVVENLTEIINIVQTWCDEMKTYLPNTRKIIDMEVL